MRISRDMAGMRTEHSLTVAISSRALFNLDESNRVFEDQGLEAYRKYQIEREDEVLEPGDAFPLVKKLININKLLGKSRVDVILLSRNSADTGLRIFNSIRAHGLDIQRAAFGGGANPYRYVQAFNCDLFLSTVAEDVAQALTSGVAAATIFGTTWSDREPTELRIAFDGDGVVFSDQAERVFQASGLDAFTESEAAAADEPLEGGPFKSFLAGLEALQREFPQGNCPIRTALVTARGAPAHERVIKTLRAWNVRLDECLFLGGRDKTEFLKAFAADVFFDDQARVCDEARGHLTTGHVPHGTMNASD
ncbi:MAG: 5'-nucleotidase [Gammaproteobacteria bacterium]|nr:5'-nucleotidase [Gammaproteobacteria bacterium]